MQGGTPFTGPFVVVGAGGHGACLAEVLVSVGAEIRGFVDHATTAPASYLGFEVMADVPQRHLENGWPVALGVGDNFQRARLHESLLRRGATDAHFPAVAHRDSSVSPFASLGPGTFIFQGANVGPVARTGRFCVVATGATATHHAEMADYAFLAVRAVLGAASLGKRSFLGVGAVVQPRCTVGADVVIGAQSLVLGDVPDRTVAYGVPASVRRSREVGEPYLSRQR